MVRLDYTILPQVPSTRSSWLVMSRYTPRPQYTLVRKRRYHYPPHDPPYDPSWYALTRAEAMRYLQRLSTRCLFSNADTSLSITLQCPPRRVMLVMCMWLYGLCYVHLLIRLGYVHLLMRPGRYSKYSWDRSLQRGYTAELGSLCQSALTPQIEDCPNARGCFSSGRVYPCRDSHKVYD